MLLQCAWDICIERKKVKAKGEREGDRKRECEKEKESNDYLIEDILNKIFIH